MTMFCRRCGAPHDESAAACGRCGLSITGGADPGRLSADGDKPSTYLAPAILSTLCCCLPFGIVAIVFASQVDSKWQAGDPAGARDASSKAKLWFWIAFGLGFVINLLVILGNLLAAIASRR